MSTAPDTDTKPDLSDLYTELAEQTRMVQSTRQLLTSLAARRRETVRELRKHGQTMQQIATELGVSKSAIQQILS